MEQNQQNEKFHVVVTNAATGEAVADWTESTVVVIASDIMDVAEGGKASSHVKGAKRRAMCLSAASPLVLHS